jgi:hypothetical protein
MFPVAQRRGTLLEGTRLQQPEVEYSLLRSPQDSNHVFDVNLEIRAACTTPKEDPGIACWRRAPTFNRPDNSSPKCDALVNMEFRAARRLVKFMDSTP